jgi:hypothetical protein
MNIPNAKILEVSRLSTFGPSLDEFCVENLMRIWNQYSSQSMTAFFGSLGISVSEIRDYLAKYKLEENEIVVYPWQDERVKNLITDKKFKIKIHSILNKNRCLLEQYLKEKGFSSDSHAVLVDIGWRGTIQDNLAHLMPGKTLIGVYLGLHAFLNQQPQNVKKIAWGPNANLTPYHKNYLISVEPLEMLTNSPTGSVTGYIAKYKTVEAVKYCDAQENSVYYKYTRYYQKGVLDSGELFCEWINTRALTSNDLHDLAMQVFNKIISAPKKEITEAFFSLAHNEQFGVGGINMRKGKIKWSLLFKALFRSHHRKELTHYLYSCGWPQGLLIRKHQYLLNRILNHKIYKG